jgi:hypothetical protein
MYGLSIIVRLNNPCEHRFVFPDDMPMRGAAVTMEKALCRTFREHMMRENASSTGHHEEDEER